MSAALIKGLHTSVHANERRKTKGGKKELLLLWMAMVRGLMIN
jgi:hypothetical protein